MTLISQNIRKYREYRNLTQQELALKMRIGTKKIEMYESGELIPDKQTLLKLSTVLDLPASYLLEQEYKSKKKLPTEIMNIIEEIGIEKASFILNSFKAYTEEELLYAIEILTNKSLE